MSKGIAISLLYLKYTTFVTVNSTGEIIPCAFNKCNNCAPVCWVQNHDMGQSKWLPRQSTTNSTLWHSRSVQNSGHIWPIHLRLSALLSIGVTAYRRNVYRRVNPVSL